MLVTTWSRLVQGQLSQHTPSASILAHLVRRAYATPGRPKGVVGEPSKLVKRAVKTTPTTSGRPSSVAQKTTSETRVSSTANAKSQTQTKKKTPLTREQKAARREKVAQQKAIEKEKLTARKEKKKAKLAAQKAKLADPKRKEAALKKTALSPPSIEVVSAWNMYLRERIKGKTLKNIVAESGVSVSAKAFKALRPEEIEHYNHLANVESQKRHAEFDAWLKQHTVFEIQAANNARRALNRLQPVAKGHRPKWTLIQDSRLPTRPLNSYARFSRARHASGDLKSISVPEAAKLIAAEWKALSEDEKQKWTSQATAETKRYESDLQQILISQPLQAEAQASAAA